MSVDTSVYSGSSHTLSSPPAASSCTVAANECQEENGDRTGNTCGQDVTQKYNMIYIEVLQYIFLYLKEEDSDIYICLAKNDFDQEISLANFCFIVRNMFLARIFFDKEGFASRHIHH